MLELNVQNIYSGYHKKCIVNDVSFSCYQGELTFIIGANGCGKTTLLKSVSQLLKYQGKVSFNLNDVKNWSKKKIAKNIAYLSQIETNVNNYSIYDTVLMGRYAYLKSRLSNYQTSDHQMVLYALERVGMSSLKDMNLKSCSGGQLQRVMIARLIAQDPKIIIIDEITNHLDFKYQIEILNYIRGWAKDENKIVLGVLHDLNLIRAYADKVLMMKNGEIRYSGNADSVLTKYNLQDIYDADVMTWYQVVSQKWEEKQCEY